MKRDLILKIPLNSAEMAAVTASAELTGLTKTEYGRRRITGRPMKAQNVLAKSQRQLERQKVREEAEERQRAERAAQRAAEREEQVIRDKRYREQAKQWEKARLRREKAERLAREAGGATAWFRGMSAKDREYWGDLEMEMLAAETLSREAAESMTRYTSRPDMTETTPRPAVRAPRVGSGQKADPFTTLDQRDDRPFETDGGLIID